MNRATIPGGRGCGGRLGARNVEPLLPEAVRLRDLLTATSRGQPRPELSEMLVRSWKEELTLLLATADRMGADLSVDTSQNGVCAACMLGMAKQDLQCFASAIDAFLKVGKVGRIAPSARTTARLREEAGRLQWKLDFIVTVAGVC